MSNKGSLGTPRVIRLMRQMTLPDSSHNTYTECREFAIVHHASRLFTREGAALCGVTPRTYRRWLRGEYPAPGSALRLIRLAGTGDMGQLHRHWQGWFMSLRGELVSPYGLTFKPGDLDAEPFYRRLAEDLRRERDALRGQLDTHPQWFPGACEAAYGGGEDSAPVTAALALPPAAGAGSIPNSPSGTESGRPRNEKETGLQGGNRPCGLESIPQ